MPANWNCQCSISIITVIIVVVIIIRLVRGARAEPGVKSMLGPPRYGAAYGWPCLMGYRLQGFR